MRIVALVIAAAAWSAFGGLGQARDRVVGDWSGRATLACGGTVFSSFVRGHDFLALVQLVTGKRSGRSFDVDLREQRVRTGNPVGAEWVMSGVADSWKCVHGLGGAAVMLFYTCQMGMMNTGNRGDCVDNQEWSRFVDVSGRLLDKGYAIEDSRYGKLDDEYGVARSEGSEITGLRSTY